MSDSFPPLPKAALTFTKHGDEGVFTADQMREYVLADRASRSPVVGAVGGEPKPVAWMWEYIGPDPIGHQIKPCARALHEMDPHNPPHPNHWRPVHPLYESARVSPTGSPEGEVSNG